MSRWNVHLLKLGSVKSDEEKQKMIDKYPIYYEYSPYQLAAVIHSLRVPSSVRMKKRIESYYEKLLEDEENPQILAKEIVDNIPLPFVYTKSAYHMYAKFFTILWKEDGLVKGVQFFFSRCPSGGCDGESIHFMVATDLDDFFSMLYHQYFNEEDKEKIRALLAELNPDNRSLTTE